jgi:hypothetical protein
MRLITEHHTNSTNRAIKIEADEPDPNNGNASHEYDITAMSEAGCDYGCMLSFQHGPIGTTGINGITNEALLVIVADRLRGFQSSKYACVENAVALASVGKALEALELRTRNREGRGVEGSHEV